MNIYDAIIKLAGTFDLDPEDCQSFAAMDTIGGFHADPALRRWDTGSIWQVEGQVLYALIRATQPHFIVNLGVYQGCSLAHMMAAINTIQVDDPKYKPTVIGVDLYRPQSIPDGVKFLGMDALEYVEQQMPTGKVDLLFEDLYHGVDSTRRVWMAAREKVKKGGFVISHDAAHFLVGTDVRLGILASGVLDPLILAIEPSDCGLAVWRKP